MKLAITLLALFAAIIGIGCVERVNVNVPPVGITSNSTTTIGIADNRVCGAVPECAKQCNDLFATNPTSRTQCLAARVGQVLNKASGDTVIFNRSTGLFELASEEP